MSEDYADGLMTRADALIAGFSDGELARMVRRGDLLRVQRGAYLSAGATPVTSAAARHRVVIAATMRALRVPGVVSHASAAVLHGLPLWRVPLGRVHVIRRPPAGGSGSSRVHLHVARLPDDEITVADGVAARLLRARSWTWRAPRPSSPRSSLRTRPWPVAGRRGPIWSTAWTRWGQGPGRGAPGE